MRSVKLLRAGELLCAVKLLCPGELLRSGSDLRTGLCSGDLLCSGGHLLCPGSQLRRILGSGRRRRTSGPGSAGRRRTRPGSRTQTGSLRQSEELPFINGRQNCDMHRTQIIPRHSG